MNGDVLIPIKQRTTTEKEEATMSENPTGGSKAPPGPEGSMSTPTGNTICQRGEGRNSSISIKIPHK